MSDTCTGTDMRKTKHQLRTYFPLRYTHACTSQHETSLRTPATCPNTHTCITRQPLWNGWGDQSLLLEACTKLASVTYQSIHAQESHGCIAKPNPRQSTPDTTTLRPREACHSTFSKNSFGSFFHGHWPTQLPHDAKGRPRRGTSAAGGTSAAALYFVAQRRWYLHLSSPH